MAVTARISKSGQVTIPAEIREKMGVKPGDAVIWSTDEQGKATVRAVRYSLEDLDGILGPLPPGMGVNELIDEAAHEAIERRYRRWREQNG